MGLLPESITAGLTGHLSHSAQAYKKLNGLVYDVKNDYGAVGDGVADDTSVLNLAIAAANTAGGGTVFFPKGTYKVTSTLTLFDNVRLLGVGYASNLALAVTGTTYGLGGTNLDQVEIANLRISGSAARALAFVTATKLHIHDCFISGATVNDATNYSAGIWIDGGTDCLIENNHLSENGIGASANRSADILFYTTANTRNRILTNRCASTATHFSIGTYNLSYSKIVGNHCASDISDASNNSGYGILVYETGASGTNTHHNVIEGNTVYDTDGTGIYLVNCGFSTVANNIVEICATAQTDVTLPVGGIAINNDTGSDNCTVTGNMIRNSTINGIVTAGSATRHTISGNTVTTCSDAGIRIRGASNYSTISGNTVTACARGIFVYNTAVIGLAITGNTVTSSTSTLAGINTIPSLTDSVISNNVCVLNGGYGISIEAGSRNVVNGNVCRNNSAGAAGVRSGIIIACTDTVVTGNSSFNSGTSNQKYGIEDVSAGTGNVITGNHFSGNATGSLSVIATATMVFNNFGGPAMHLSASGVPSNTLGANGDFYDRSDGTAAGNTVIYHKEAGAWVALTTT